jgi:hypothetical protein
MLIDFASLVSLFYLNSIPTSLKSVIAEKLNVLKYWSIDIRGFIISKFLKATGVSLMFIF